MLRHLRNVAPGLTGVDTGRDSRQRRFIGDQLGQAIRLVIRQRVHRVQQQRLHARVALRAGTCRVIQHGVEKGLRLTRAGTRDHQRGIRTALPVLAPAT